MQLSSILTPSWCRWQVDNPPKFTIWHNLLYALAGGVFSANLYYSHPILEVMAQDFNTNQSGVANIPTLAQAGNATGLLLILPLADFFPRRKFSLILLTVTFIFWIGMCITPSLTIFQTLTYLSAVTTGIIQILVVLVAELSTPETRAFNISIVAMGPTLGILLARILSGLLANYTAWRNVYWLALALQGLMLLLMYLFMPDYPATTPTSTKKVIKDYPSNLLSILTLFTKHPPLVQVSILSFLTFFTVASFWTTLTFLLSSQPYNYSTLTIGLFGLIGASTLILGPLFAKYIVQPLRAPLLSCLVAITISLSGILLGTFLGPFNVSGPVMQAILLDAGLMILQVSNRVQIHGIEPGAANRVNTAFALCLYLGMLAGTKGGNDVFAGYGGWKASGVLSVGVMAVSYLVVVIRGPHESGWIGWSGGWARNEVAGGEKEDGDADADADVEKGVESVESDRIGSIEKVSTTLAGPENVSTVVK